MNVFGDVEKLFVGLYFNVFVSSLKEGAGVLVFVLKIHGVSDHYPSHEVRNAGLFGGLRCLFKKKMKMVGHEAIGSDLNRVI